MKEFYKGFTITLTKFHQFKDDEVWRPFSKPTEFKAVLEKSPCRGRNDDVIFTGKIREVKKQIREFWEK